MMRDIILIDPSEEDLDFLLKLFKGRDDAYGEEAIDAAGKRKFLSAMKHLYKSLLAKHIMGNKTVGVFLMQPNNTVKFMVIDIDISKEE